jgi:hypothetical protein
MPIARAAEEIEPVLAMCDSNAARPGPMAGCFADNTRSSNPG